MQPRSVRIKRSKEAEFVSSQAFLTSTQTSLHSDIQIEQEILLQSNGTEYNSDISVPHGSTPAEDDVQRARERTQNSDFAETAVDLKHATRQYVLDSFTYELLNRRWASADLIDHTFDDIVPISLAAKITLCFLHYGILSVEVGRKTIHRIDWPEACLHAASLARLASKVNKVTEEMKECYCWSWSEHLSTGTERGAQQFLNIVGVLGYIFADLFDLDSKGLSERRLRTRIMTLPRSYGRLSLGLSDSQDYGPNFLAFHPSAFVTESERDPIRIQEYFEECSILSSISPLWPQLSKSYPEIFPSSSQGVGTSSHDKERFIGPLSSTSEGYDELVDDVLNGRYTVNEGVEDMDALSKQPELFGDLLPQLKALLQVLETKDAHSLSPSVSEDLKKYDNAKFLDLSAACPPNVLISGEGKQTDMKSAIVQATVYMRQQRRTQPWLRFCLGLMATKDKMGLLRADATGVEECVFSKNIGRGVIESIRLSLGILLATDQELGQHPSFSLRTVTKMIAEPEDDDPTATVGTKRPAVDDDNDRSSKKQRSRTSGNVPSTPTKSPDPPKRLTFREVNWVTLDTERLRGQSLADKKPTIFYVKYLIEDRGSLIGRCTRVWCVYQEVFESDPLPNQHRHEIPEGSRVFKGPFALKVYNADMYSEAYEQDILVKTMEINQSKPLKGLLLPTHVWYFGEILTLVRGLTQEEHPPTIPLSNVKHRQEIFTISALKRTLSQFQTIEEFYDAIIGVLEAIESLEAIKIMHRDISFGNIILNKEIYCDTDKECQWIDVEQEDSHRAHVALIRRDPVDIGTIGGLHDLDMAAHIPETVFTKKSKKPPVGGQTENVKSSVLAVQEKPQRDWRTWGTQPFMSINILLGGQHSVPDDLQSVFFVCYLSLFTFGKRRANCFPNAPLPLAYSWPQDCRNWTDMTIGKKMRHLGLFKRDFFLSPDDFWYEAANSAALPLWTTRTNTLKAVHWDMLYTFHKQLWVPHRPLTAHEEETLGDNGEVTPLLIRMALQTIKDGLDMTT